MTERRGDKPVPCPRCGCPMHARSAVCRDCRETDPEYLRLTGLRPQRSQLRQT